MFKGLTAWFLRSVSRNKRQKWFSHGGKEASLDNAQFIFSQDAQAPDTLRIFESTAYLDEHLSIFHSNYISECVKKGGTQSVALGKYILLPAEVQEVVQREMGIKFHWETDGNTSDGQSVHSDSEDELPEPGKNIQNQQKNEDVKVSDERAGGIETQSLSRTVSKQKENQSNTKPNVCTKNQSSTGQENSLKRKQQNQSTERRQPDTALKDVRKNYQSRDSKEQESHAEKRPKKNAVSNVEKKSPNKREQGAHEKPTEGKRQKLEGSTVTAAEKEEVWRLENLAKVMDKIDDFSVGHRGYDVYDKRRKKTVN